MVDETSILLHLKHFRGENFTLFLDCNKAMNEEEHLKKVKLKTMAEIVKSSRQSSPQKYMLFCIQMMHRTGCTQEYLDARINEYADYNS